MKTIWKNQRWGFTLVEIMVVVAILSLLLAIVIPNYVRARANSQANACINNLSKIEEATSTFALEKGRKTGDPVVFPDDLIPYIKMNLAGSIPPCPAGGTYTCTTIGTNPTCTLSSLTPPHAIE